MGGFTPFYSLVYALVPGTKYFRAPSTMLFVVSFCLATLAAFGAERIARGEFRQKYLVGWGVAAALIALLGMAGGLTNLAVSLAPPQRTEVAMMNDSALKIDALRSAIFALLAVAAAWAIPKRRISRDLATTLVALVVATDLWTIVRLYWNFMPPAAVSYATNDAFEYMKGHGQPTRVYSLRTAQSDVWRDADLEYDGPMVHDIPQVLGYHGNQLASYDRLAGADEGYRQIGNPNFWRLANMKYILTNSADSLGIPGMKTVAGPTKSAAGNTLYLHELPVETAYAWVTPVMLKADEASILNTVLDPRFDVRSAALFDSSASVQAPKELRSLPKPLAVKAAVQAYRPGYARIVLDTPAPEGAALMVSENWYPGWTATVDGKATPVGKADVTFIGVPLEAGATTIELRFTNPPYETGKLVTWGAIALALLLAGVGALADRRGSAAVA
jgi:hypothetical protein